MRSHPDIAVEIFRLEPSFAATFLEFGDDSAADVIAQWLEPTKETKTLRIARKAMLPLETTARSERLLRALLSNLEPDEPAEILTTLELKTDGFSDPEVRRIIEEQICTTFPVQVRSWSAEKNFWSPGISAIATATYSHSRPSVVELFDDSPFSAWQRANIVGTLIVQASSGVPYWLRELLSSDPRISSSLLNCASPEMIVVDAALERILHNVPDLPFAKIPNLWNLVGAFEERPFFEKLFNEALQDLLGAFLATGSAKDYESFAASRHGEKWSANVFSSSLRRIVGDACRTGVEGVFRSWQWVAKAQRNVFGRDAIVSELVEDLLRYSRYPFPSGAELSMIAILQRSRREISAEARHHISSKLLRFSFDNTSCPLGGVVAESFADVYEVAVQESPKSSSLPSLFFGSFEWDRGKDMRVALIDTFVRSQWRPGDLAVAADRAGILRKIFKRLHRKYDGDNYIRAMMGDLRQHTDGNYQDVSHKLEKLIADPNFYEEWD